jgi:hypothetical protein
MRREDERKEKEESTKDTKGHEMEAVCSDDQRGPQELSMKARGHDRG